MKWLSFFITLILIVNFPEFGWASNGTGLGGVASNVLEPVGLFSDFVSTACFAIGAAFLFASMIKYREHRVSPLMVPISTVVFLLIAGIVLVALPFLALVAEGGVRYSLFR